MYANCNSYRPAIAVGAFPNKSVPLLFTKALSRLIHSLLSEVMVPVPVVVIFFLGL